MIKQLDLQNFQSHKETNLEFEPGVNVIIGPSDSGKTSMIRALRWVVWNRPLGDAFRSNWGGDTIARVHFDDGCMVERLEADNDRHYRTDANGYQLEFKAFGTEVPEEVEKLLNFSEINLQEQMDNSFLISDNPGQVSRHFNKIANIDAIDSSLRNVEGWVRGIRNDKKAAEQEIERHKKKLQGFAYLDKMEADVEVLEQLDSQHKSIKNKATTLFKIVRSIEDLSEQIKTKSKILSAEPAVSKLISYSKKRSKKVQRYKKLRSLHQKISVVSDQLATNKELTDGQDIVDNVLALYEEKEQIRKKLRKLNKLKAGIVTINSQLETSRQLTDGRQAIDNVLSLYKKKENIENKWTELDDLKDDIIYVNDQLVLKKKRLSGLEEQWHDEAPDTCPLCNGTGKLN